MITGKITLSKLISKIIEVTGKDGNPVKGIFIPIELNHLYFKPATGQIDLNFVAFDYTPKTETKDTHLIKQSFLKEVREAMTEEQRRSYPILGNLAVMDEKPQTFKADANELPF